MRQILGLFALAVALSAPAAQAAIIHVPGGAPTIQVGIDIASLGDTVLVAPGTYTGAGNRDIDFDGGSVILRGEQGAGNTIIDCQGLSRGFYFHSGEDTTAVVQGFTIQHAAADSGAGAMCRNGSSPRFLECAFRENTATAIGGGTCFSASSPVLRDCFFGWNEASGGANSYGGGMACLVGAQPTVALCEFYENTAAGLGGAVFCEGAAPQFKSCDLVGNSAASGGGGAVFSLSLATPTFDDCIFEENVGSQGAAIYTQSSAVTATRCRFFRNSSRAVSFLYPQSTGQLSYCTFAGNGCHAFCFDGANAAVSNCTFVGNTSGSGAIQVNEASPTIEDCIIAFSAAGPAAACWGSASPTFEHCVVFANAGGDDLCGSVGDTLHRQPLFCDMESDYYALCSNSACAQINNPWGRQIGAFGAQCVACESPVEPASWGAVKAMFR